MASECVASCARRNEDARKAACVTASPRRGGDGNARAARRTCERKWSPGIEPTRRAREFTAEFFERGEDLHRRRRARRPATLPSRLSRARAPPVAREAPHRCFSANSLRICGGSKRLGHRRRGRELQSARENWTRGFGQGGSAPGGGERSPAEDVHCIRRCRDAGGTLDGDGFAGRSRTRGKAHPNALEFVQKRRRQTMRARLALNSSSCVSVSARICSYSSSSNSSRYSSRSPRFGSAVVRHLHLRLRASIALSPRHRRCLGGRGSSPRARPRDASVVYEQGRARGSLDLGRSASPVVRLSRRAKPHNGGDLAMGEARGQRSS